MLTMQNPSKTSKVLGFLRGHKPAVAAASFVCAVSSMALTAGAEEVGGGGASSAYQTVITTVSGTLSEANLTSVLTYAVGAAIVLVFFWWAVRKCAGIIKRAFMRGKLKL